MAEPPRQRAAVPQPEVAPAVYDEEYFRHCCAGGAEWVGSDGREVAGRYPGSLVRAGLRPGDVLVDVGTGRGELLAVAVHLGARRAIGIETSATAVAMARHTIEVHGVGDSAEVLLADARRIDLDEATADLVTLLDVVEHLTPAELLDTLREARRVLKPGGRVVAHTFPTRTLYNVTYRFQRLAWPPRWSRWPADPRNEYEHLMHVNEQSLGSLRGVLRRAGFSQVRVEVGQAIYADFVPDARARRLYGWLAKLGATARFGISDLWAEGTKSG